MKKLTLILIAISISFNLLNAQTTCLEDGITFTTQSQIDSFQINYPDCSKILGDVDVWQLWGGVITNLNGLNSIQVIDGSFSIKNTDNLHNLDGLESLDSIAGYISIGQEIIETELSNDSLNNIDGLVNLSYVGGIEICCSPMLENLDSLVNLTSIGGSLIIRAGGWPYPMTSVLENIDGLSNLISINGQVKIQYLESLTSLQGLQNIDSEGINSISIKYNQNLSFCEVASVCSYLLNGGDNNILDNAIGCNSEAEVLLACASVGVSEITSKKPFSIYPNPSNGNFTVDIGGLEQANLRIINLSGQLIHQELNIVGPLVQLTFDAPSGIYLLILSTNDFNYHTKIYKN